MSSDIQYQRARGHVLEFGRLVYSNTQQNYGRIAESYLIEQILLRWVRQMRIGIICKSATWLVFTKFSTLVFRGICVAIATRLVCSIAAYTIATCNTGTILASLKRMPIQHYTRRSVTYITLWCCLLLTWRGIVGCLYLLLREAQVIFKNCTLWACTLKLLLLRL